MADVQVLATGTQAAPLDYLVKDAQEIIPRACFAHFDGTGAAGSFLPTLQIISDSGHTIAEIPIDASVAAGSSVEATWGPFLRSQAAAAAGGVDQPWGLWQAQAITIATGAAFTSVNFDTALVGRFFGSSGDGVCTLGVVSPGILGPIINVKGTYLVSWHVQGFTNAAPAAGSTIELACDFDTGDYVSGLTQGGFSVTGAGPQRVFECGLQELLDLDPANYPIPNTGRVSVRQNSGGNLSCYFTVVAVRQSTVTDPGVL